MFSSHYTPSYLFTHIFLRYVRINCWGMQFVPKRTFAKYSLKKTKLIQYTVLVVTYASRYVCTIFFCRNQSIKSEIAVSDSCIISFLVASWSIPNFYILLHHHHENLCGMQGVFSCTDTVILLPF